MKRLVNSKYKKDFLVCQLKSWTIVLKPRNPILTTKTDSVLRLGEA